MPGPLLVPLAVDAWVLNRQTLATYAPTADSIRAEMDYCALADLQDPRPAPFHQDTTNFVGDTKNHGVYVLWTLPAALRHGRPGPDGAIAFPHIPNRWLVIRLLRPASAAVTDPPQMAAWIVQSDALGEAGGSRYLDPQATTATQTTLGRRVSLSDARPWQEPAPADSYFLTAVAESNVEFAAYQPFNENVLSIRDCLVTEGTPPGTLSYQVIGWYSDPTADVLAGWVAGAKGNDWSDLLARLGWTAPDGAATHASLYQGFAPGVPWEPDGTGKPTKPPQMQVALGNTSADAVVAYARAAITQDPVDGMTADGAADLLEAFQYNLLPLLGQPGAEQAIEDRIRAHWFAPSGGGTTWTIVPAVGALGEPPPEPPSAEALSQQLAREATWLPALNADQATYDANARALLTSRRRLLELWWKAQLATLIYGEVKKLPWGINSLAQLDAAVSAEQQTAQGLMTAMAAARTGKAIPHPDPGQTLDDAVAAFAQAKGLPAWRTLKPVSRPPFFAPADPVMMISGTQSGMAIDPDVTLACRTAAELTSGLELSTGDGHSFAITSDQLRAHLPSAAWANLPPLVPALYAELFLLDPASAALAGAVAGESLTPAQAQAVAASIATPKPTAGTAPALPVTWPWTQPWRPVYLDWSVDWLPIPFDQWRFDGLDYGTVPAARAGKATTLTGRTLLTPKPGFEFRERLKQFVTDNPDSSAATQLGDLDQAITTLDDWDFLSQAFSGLTTQVALWDPIPVGLGSKSGTLTDLLGEALHAPPQSLLDGVTEARHKPVPTHSDFEGLRGGQLYFTRLAIVDAFGQALDIVTQQESEAFAPLLADGMQPEHPALATDTQRLAQLPPRVLQPARLNLTFVPAASGTPIVGWVLPNHLDQALSVYGPDGTAYGELRPAADTTGAAFVEWSATATGPYATLGTLLAAQPDLGGFLNGLATAGTTALSAFIDAVDETLWTVDPLGTRSDALLSVLLGRPLAVATATLALELQADAYRDPSWPFTFTTPVPHFVGYRFPVRLGDLGLRQDGLLGYCLDRDYSHFHAIAKPTADPYLDHVEPGNYVDVAFAASGAGPARKLTLLIDPRASVHAACGILPTTVTTLDAAWVDDALKGMEVAFRGGPLVASELVDQTGVLRLDLPSPAERHGTWSWSELGPDGRPRSIALRTPDPSAVFPDTPPGLREGFLHLSEGLGD